MSWADRALLLVNELIPKRRRPGARTDADSYSQAQYGWAAGDLELFAGLFDVRGKHVLDAGCGPGGKTAFYAELGPAKITGVDRSPENIAQAERFAKARGLTNVELVVGNLGSLPFPAETFDAVLMSDVVEHVDRAVLASAFAELARVLRPGGEVALYFPPWTSFDASHLYGQIRIPWCHLLFGDETLRRMLQAILRDEGRADAAMIQYHELNRLTIEEFRALIDASDLEIRHFRLKTIKGLPATGVPAIDRLLTKRVVAILGKRPGAAPA